VGDRRRRRLWGNRMIKSEHSLLHYIQTIFESGTMGELTDRQLLERFAVGDREQAEPYFAALIKRHGPMVLHTCQSILHDRPDAEDAFQATFLVLARKARSLWIRDSLGPWLFEVACRVAACARSAALRRRKHEREAARMGATTMEDKTWDDRSAALYEELRRLPDRYRAAVVLCDLEGLTQERAAQLLGWPAGTVRSRLARGRQRLRDRLTRRGLAPSVVPALPWLTADAPSAAVPAKLAEITTNAAVRFIANSAVTGTIASVGSLTEGVLRVMLWSKLKLIIAGILAGGLFAGTALLAFWSADLQQGQSPAVTAETPAKDRAEAKPRPIAQASAGAQSLSSNAMARLDVAKKLRDKTYERWRIDPNASFSDVLSRQNRFYDVVGEVLVKTDADRVRFLEHRVATLKRIEQFVRELFKNKFLGSIDVLAVELDRLEAEDRLEKARARVGASGAAPVDALSSELVQFLNQDTWTPEAPWSQSP
jgi:RNA polymerase sigma factor (sigma-70 family)